MGSRNKLGVCVCVCVCVSACVSALVCVIYFEQLDFLVADTQLYKRLCPPVRWSVGRLVGRSVGRSVCHELRSRKTLIYAPAHPSATGGRVSGLVFILFNALLELSGWWLVQ